MLPIVFLQGLDTTNVGNPISCRRESKTNVAYPFSCRANVAALMFQKVGVHSGHIVLREILCSGRIHCLSVYVLMTGN